MDFEPLLSPIVLTLALALCVTVVLLIIATPLAWWLSQGRG
ncbi:MAG: molybdate ABC transporter permease subunit, partial [Rhodococcus sp. (in: high G+C Gram-positive bacteria)]